MSFWLLQAWVLMFNTEYAYVCGLFYLYRLTHRFIPILFITDFRFCPMSRLDNKPAVSFYSTSAPCNLLEILLNTNLYSRL